MIISAENIIASYTNGNTTVTIKEDGTKIREYYSYPKPEHPESIDIKITDYCDMGCLYCHESSTKKGKHADIEVLLKQLDCLPKGVELAIGGGNPLSHPDLIYFLSKLKKRGIIVNITVNQGHLKPYFDLIKDLIEKDLVKGIGISITNSNFKYINSLLELTDNIVHHIIAGVNDISVMDALTELKNPKVLILGYKKYGFGINHHNKEVDVCIKKWFMYLPKYIGKCIISFDNLAIEQLNIKRLFTVEGWNNFYMGDDFCFTMYIDAVKQQYAPTSRSSEKSSFGVYNNLNEYFKLNRNI